MRFVMLAAVAALPSVSDATEECPVSLILNVEELTRQDQTTAQRYASCMSVPYLPTSSQLIEKAAECLANRPANSSEKLKAVLDWADHIASQFPGCETRLEIKKK